ncbi:MAG: Ig-like domain-containing protein, partial [Chloroflexota bacterium]
GLSLTLGCGEVKLLDMVYAFSVFDNLGTMVGRERDPEERELGQRELDPVSILHVEDKDGNVLYRYSQPARRDILTSQLAWLMNNIMSDRGSRCPAFGCPNALELPDGRPAAAKTGTTNSYKDAWTIGFTPQLVSGVWVGNSNNEEMENVPGSKGAAPIWNAFMSYALRNEPLQEWPEPSGINSMQVCATSGLLPTAWCPTRNEFFVQGTEPTTPDTIYQPYRVNKETGRLATVYTPPELVEEKVFTILPPEATDWLAGLSEEEREQWPQPPAEYDTIVGPSPDTGPLAFVNPLPFAYVSGIVELVGMVQVDNLAYYRVAYGSGLNPGAWQMIGSEHDGTKNNEVLEIWDTTGLDGLYTVQLAAVRHDQSFESTSIQVTVDNQPPEIELTFPLPEQEFIYPDDEWVTVQPLAMDNVSLDYVEFFVDGAAVGRSSVSPFSFQWTIGGAVGRHSVHAVAYDAAGNSTTSSSIVFNVSRKAD